MYIIWYSDQLPLWPIIWNSDHFWKFTLEDRLSLKCSDDLLIWGKIIRPASTLQLMIWAQTIFRSSMVTCLMKWMISEWLLENWLWRDCLRWDCLWRHWLSVGLFAGLSAGLCAMWKQNCVAKVSKLWFHVKNVIANLYIIETYRSTKYVQMAKYLGTDHEAKNKISHIMHNIQNSNL